MCGSVKVVICAVEGAALRDVQRGRQEVMGNSRWGDEPEWQGHSSRNGRSGGDRYDSPAGARSTGGAARGSRGTSWDEWASRGSSGGDSSRSYQGRPRAEYGRSGRGRPPERGEYAGTRDRSVRAARPLPREDGWEAGRSRGSGSGQGSSGGRYRSAGGGGLRSPRYDP